MAKDDSVNILAQRSFTMADQNLFASLSGDVNPLHVDEIRARRTLIGDVAVHGMHTLLWSINVLAEQRRSLGNITHIDVRFPKPLHPNELVALNLTKETPTALHLRATVGSKVVAQIKLDISPSYTAIKQISADRPPLPPQKEYPAPQELSFPSIPGMQGLCPTFTSANDFDRLFPAAANLMGSETLRTLGACSYLVGIICPGAQSIFSRLNVDTDTSLLSMPLSYRVIEADERFLLVRHKIEGGGLRGEIEAFAPPPPPRQMSVSDLKLKISADEFSGQRALVIGGSRGLGELTSKIIAAGGGEVALTYAKGKEDAENVAQNLATTRTNTRILRFDVTQDNQAFYEEMATFRPTHVYYFATCQIFRHKSQAFELERLRTFMAFYVDGFWNLCRHLAGACPEHKMSIYYPSSVAVAERPPGMTEYAMAKASGEILCTDMDSLLPKLAVHIQRLPRLLTDQTNLVTRQDLSDPVDILLPIYRSMQQS
ncbi:MAG: SDR family NAD(P)-dependent oxidoreductase [Alphaproteobacteria bacterium]|nr:SDR family NAD(P)-dependent oxidoreductase [Alphaproteobacteria bacterium]